MAGTVAAGARFTASELSSLRFRAQESGVFPSEMVLPLTVVVRSCPGIRLVSNRVASPSAWSLSFTKLTKRGRVRSDSGREARSMSRVRVWPTRVTERVKRTSPRRASETALTSDATRGGVW